MENQIPTAKFSSNYGIILGIILILIHVLMYVSGMLLEGKQWPMYLYYLIFPVFIFSTIHSYKKKNNSFLSLGQAIKIGISIAALSGLVYAVYNGIFNFFIEPDFIDQMMEVTREKMMENPNMTEEQIEMSINWAKKLGGPIIGGAFFILLSVFFGFIYSLIGGLIMQKKQDLY
ncbi:uncharacterized protein DUF4199 [Aquimarina sp. MAR_2010_214]|uniref:DUF4199 domain-containing protein n=1 Tax=Aquimarina sp. MAR_2010_214 TaxID=1250026 RepID=UPI000C7072D3|nr:DUF4199 domain-containing protein [Aquimarina sp. MAR_2010_214]PKV50495.1 uncharacterized protein DUF4199 [Aquimarina sp. MAR_2010_214]